MKLLLLKNSKIIKKYFGKAYQLFSRVTFAIAAKVTKRSRKELKITQQLEY
ncbi:hypothetical protein [Orenia metallireducens]|uniref:hypothetical protein n=1 Tax=Orenia metallireducens TaxID=1413210 RepID=UPI00159F262A|nr:hypothetical protein [Orenia metallireducens]